MTVAKPVEELQKLPKMDNPRTAADNPPDRVFLRSELPPQCKRRIKQVEERFGRKCRRLWGGTNPKGEYFLYGWFIKNRTDKLIVTIAHFHPRVGFIPQE